ncbi:DUF3291 domain-containing protein [Shewanella psychropiezotolerans]|uniref:DUF3291 domain-containing protein n=1 Tax=Shewanella psychropiezotolerans TaxID=2593655 RepID=A0ABX5X5H5_9GAMM|nr:MULTISPECIES: DUF3291 domain-containing protein [Shewanella]MPY22443.1 DUF3291 domain-containing protein [Shewanella sp. YLB-07]QDO86606.1 DUF3291 domain-containing protein [Shewanella psychropiezotolerans]
MQLAQLNIARTKAAMDEPLMKEFVDNLEPINAIAESSQGFVWRLQDESGDATSIQAFDDPSIIVNMSVWESVEALKGFIFKTHHIRFLKRKSEWFDRLEQANYVIWWVPEGYRPDVEEGKERLMYLRKHGESDYAFSFKHKGDKVLEENV